MNNKGQSLVVFVLLLPFVTLLIASLFEFGNYMLVKQTHENEIKDAIKYGFKHSSDTDLYDKLSLLLKENLDGDFDILITDDYIKITNNGKVKSLYKVIDDYSFSITYVGYKNEGKIKKE